MITKNDLEEAIAECQGARSPNANTCIKLASYYVIKDHLEKSELPVVRLPYAEGNSYDAGSRKYRSDTQFGKAIEHADDYDVMQTIDELLETLRVLQPRLYDAFIRKITAL